jgi:hypothetical protein
VKDRKQMAKEANEVDMDLRIEELQKKLSNVSMVELDDFCVNIFMGFAIKSINAK